MSWLERLFEAQLTIGSQQILWREVIGNVFGFASAIGGLRRRVWAWPVGIVGNALLFTVFFGVAFSNPQHTTLFGQAARQIFFIITSVYGWWRWNQVRRVNHAEGKDRPVLTPRWATARERLAYRRLLGRGRRRPAVGLRRGGRRLARPALVLLVRRLDLRRVDRRDLCHGPRLERLLAGLDRGRPRRRAPARPLEVLPVRGPLRRLRRTGHLRVLRVAQGLAHERAPEPRREEVLA